MLNQFEPDSPAFNLGGRIVLEEEVNESFIREALAVLAKRHESFRTYFKTIGGEPVQVLRPAVEIYLEKVDLAANPPAEIEKQRQYLLAQESKVPFDLEKPPLVRSKLIKCGDKRYELLFTMHHIISDGWSLEVLQEEFLLLYESYKNHKENPLPPLFLQYRDYAAWHNRLLEDEKEMEAAKTFWKNQLSGKFDILRLPYDYAKTDSIRGGSAGYRIVIPADITARLRVIAREQKASLFMVLLSGYNLLLSRVSGQEDILLGVPGAARQHQDLKHIMGLFVNTLILRNCIDPKDSFYEILKRVQKNMIQVLEYQSFPLELVCGELKIRYPEISTFFNMSNFGDIENRKLEDRETYHIREVQEAKFDMVCYLLEYSDGIAVETHYHRGLFKPITIEKILRKYLDILENIAFGPGRKAKQKTKLKWNRGKSPDGNVQ